MSGFTQLPSTHKYVQAFAGLQKINNDQDLLYKFFHKEERSSDNKSVHTIKLEAPDDVYEGKADNMLVAFANAAGEYAGGGVVLGLLSLGRPVNTDYGGTIY